MKPRCQQLIGKRKCGLKPLARLDGVSLCSQHLFSRLAAKQGRKAA